MSTVITPSVTSALLGVSDLFAIIAASTLIAVLFLKELAGVGAVRERGDARWRFVSQALNGPIIALFTVFLVILVVRVWGVL